MASTTPMTTLIEAVPSFIQISKWEFGPIWAHSIRLTKSHFISLAPSVGTTFSYSYSKTQFPSTFIFRWSPIKILQPLSKSKLLRPLLNSLPDKIRRWSYSFDRFNRRRISPRTTRRVKETTIEEVIIKGLLLQTNRIRIFFKRWGKRNWGIEECHQGENGPERG